MSLDFEVCRLFDHLLDLFSFVDRRVGAEEVRHHVFDGSKLLLPEILFLDLFLDPFWFLLRIADQGADQLLGDFELLCNILIQSERLFSHSYDCLDFFRGQVFLVSLLVLSSRSQFVNVLLFEITLRPPFNIVFSLRQF